MKTKEQILEHLKSYGYQRGEDMKILGYLLGAKLVERGEKVEFHEGAGTFDEFFQWIHGENKKNVFADIAANLDFLLNNDGKVPERIKPKTECNIHFLLKNREYLQTCLDKKEETEAFLDDIAEVLAGINKTLESIFKK